MQLGHINQIISELSFQGISWDSFVRHVQDDWSTNECFTHHIVQSNQFISSRSDWCSYHCLMALGQLALLSQNCNVRFTSTFHARHAPMPGAWSDAGFQVCASGTMLQRCVRMTFKNYENCSKLVLMPSL